MATQEKSGESKATSASGAQSGDSDKGGAVSLRRDRDRSGRNERQIRLRGGDFGNWGLMGPSSMFDFPSLGGLFGGMGSSIWNPFASSSAASEPDRTSYDDWASSPTMDLRETDTAHELTVDLPGVPKEKLQVDLQGRQLSIVAERNEDAPGYSRFSHFSRSLTVPDNADVDNMKAAYLNGQLKLTIPKMEAGRERRRLTIT